MPAKDALEIHVGLRKAESSILTQIWTGRIGLAAFLNRGRVPDVLVWTLVGTVKGVAAGTLVSGATDSTAVQPGRGAATGGRG